MSSNVSFIVLISIIIIVIVIIIVSAIFTKNKGADTVYKKTKLQNTMLIFSIFVTIFPILPLTILSTVSAVGSGLSGELVSLWFLGGPIGFVALIRAFFNKKTKIDFWMLLYGGIAYSSLAILTITNSYKEYEDYSVLIIALKLYITFSLLVFPWYLFSYYKRALSGSSPNK